MHKSTSQRTLMHVRTGQPAGIASITFVTKLTAAHAGLMVLLRPSMTDFALALRTKMTDNSPSHSLYPTLLAAAMAWHAVHSAAMVVKLEPHGPGSLAPVL